MSDDARRFHAGAAQTLRSCTKTGATSLGLSCEEEWKKGSGVWCRSCVTTVEDPQVDGGRRPRLEGQTSRSEIDRDGGCVRGFSS